MDPKKIIKIIVVLSMYFGIFGCMIGQPVKSTPTSIPTESAIPTVVVIPTVKAISTPGTVTTHAPNPTQLPAPTISSETAAILKANGFVNITAGVSCKTPCRLFNHRDAHTEVFLYDNKRFEMTIYRGKIIGKDIFQEQFEFLQKVLTGLYPDDVVSLVMGNIKIAEEKGPSGTGDTTRAKGDYFITVKWSQKDTRIEPTISVVIWLKKG
jgi:hypothetical protein